MKYFTLETAVNLTVTSVIALMIPYVLDEVYTTEYSQASVYKLLLCTVGFVLAFIVTLLSVKKGLIENEEDPEDK